MYLYLDLETVPRDADHAAAVEELKALGQGATAKQKERADKAARDLSLSPRTGRIACLGVQAEGADARAMLCPDEEAERDALASFWSLLGPYTTLVTFNGKNFDWAFLLVRSVMLGIRPRKYCTERWLSESKRRYTHASHLDVRMELTNWDSYVPGTLQEWARAFGVAAQEDGTGRDVYDWWRNGRWDAIARHCLDDIQVLVGLHGRLL